MPQGVEKKLRKMGSKPCSVIIHEALSKCNVATIHIQLYLLKNILALQSFATHHLCGNLKFIFKTTDSLLKDLSTTFL